MSKTHYSKKFGSSGLSLRKTNFSKDELNNVTELKIFNKTKKSKESWKIFINLKKVKTPNNKNLLLTRNKFQKNNSYIPLINSKISIIQNNKVPSLVDNQREIAKFIKKEKLKQKKELDNLYNTLLLSESKLFRTSLYLTKTPIKLNHSNSNSNFSIKKNKKFFNFHPIKNNNEITGSTSIEILKGNLDKSNSMVNMNNSETKFLFPALDKNKINLNLITNKVNKNLFFKTITKNMLDELSMSRNFNNYSKIAEEINEILFNELKNKNDYAQLGKKIMIFNIISEIQNNKLKDILSMEEYNYDKKYDKLIKLRKISDNKFISFSESMNNYLQFLSDKILEHKKELSLYYNQIKELDDELEIIIIKIVKYQADLEYLVERRNFLLLIKDKLSNPPSYYEEILIRDSKKLLVGDAIFNLKITKLIKNKSLMVFNDSYLEIKEKIHENLLDINHILSDSANANIDKQLFGGVDKFIQIYKNLENKNLKYLKQLDNIRKQRDKLKRKYEKEIQLNKGTFGEELKTKEDELKKLNKQNEILLTTHNYYKETIIKNIIKKKNK